LVAALGGSDAPAYDGRLQLNYSFLEYARPPDASEIDSYYLNFASLSFNADLNACALGAEQLDELVQKIALADSWDYGFAISQPKAKGPQIFVMGASNGQLTLEEERRLNLWYQVPDKERLIRVRDVFPLNFLNEKQLGFRLQDGKTLREFIEEDEASRFREISQSLSLWSVNPSETDRVREKLLGSGVLIAK
jgi:hypothetical protein